jgi:hypothetical protein
MGAVVASDLVKSILLLSEVQSERDGLCSAQFELIIQRLWIVNADSQ